MKTTWCRKESANDTFRYVLFPSLLLNKLPEPIKLKKLHNLKHYSVTKNCKKGIKSHLNIPIYFITILTVHLLTMVGKKYCSMIKSIKTAHLKKKSIHIATEFKVTVKGVAERIHFCVRCGHFPASSSTLDTRFSLIFHLFLPRLASIMHDCKTKEKSDNEKRRA